MNFSVIKWLLYVSIFATFASAVITFTAARFRRISVEAIEHTHDIINLSQDLEILILDAETAQRGFVLTNREIYLEPYLKGVSRIPLKFVEIKNLTTDQLNQQENISSLYGHITLKQKELDSCLVVFGRNGKDSAMALINKDLGKKYMDSIRSEVAEIVNFERDLLRTKLEYLDYLTNIFNISRYLILLFVATMTSIALFMLIKKSRENKRLISQLSQINATLEQKVVERTSDLSLANVLLTKKNDEIVAQAEQIILQKRELEKRNVDLIALNQEKNKFLGMATHDLKSPINRVKGLLTIMNLNQSATVESQNQYISLALQAVSQMVDLINNLLDINKIEQSDTTLKVESIPVKKFLEDVVLIFQETAQQKSIAIRPVFLEPDLIAETDRSLLWQVLENLVSNALKFSTQNTVITITLLRSELGLKIKIADQGLGISNEDLPKIFDKFNKLANKPTGGESTTGLGLSIVKELVSDLKGTISVESEEGRGTTFALDLPFKIT